jgi:hypothetical protein
VGPSPMRTSRLPGQPNPRLQTKGIWR